MTQPNEAVGGSDAPVIAAEPTIEDRFSAVTDEGDIQQDEEEPQGDAAPADELDGIDLEDTLEPEGEADEPPITPPVSWTAEEKEEFKSLPRALQETLTRREAEREKFVQSKAQEVKATRLQVEQAALEQQSQMQNAHVQHLIAMLPEVPAEPSAHLQISDPHAYADQLEARKWALSQHTHVQKVIETVEQHLQSQQQAVEAQEAELFHTMLRDQFPEFLDPAKGPDLNKQLTATALALGYSEDQLPAANARDILAIRQASEWKAKADKFDTLMAKQMERVRDAKKLPKVSRPGVPQGKGAIEGQRYASDRKAMRDGDRDAATRVFSRFV